MKLEMNVEGVADFDGLDVAENGIAAIALLNSLAERERERSGGD